MAIVYRDGVDPLLRIAYWEIKLPVMTGTSIPKA